MLIIDWSSEQYFTSWEEWLESFDYEKIIQEIINEKRTDDKNSALDIFITECISAKTITVLYPDFNNFENNQFELIFNERKE